MDADNLDKLDAVIGAMTPGPWEIEREELSVYFSDEEQEQAYPERIGPLTIEHDDDERVEADARGIATLRNVAPELLAVVRAGRAATAPGAKVIELYGLCDALDDLDAKLAEVLP